MPITTSYDYQTDKLTVTLPAGLSSVISFDVYEFSIWGRHRLLSLTLPNISPSALVIATLDESNLIYLSRHICRLDSNLYSQASQRDSKWRIASNIDLFPNLSVDGSLTPQQEEIIDKLIEEFKRLYVPSILIEGDYIAAP